MSRRFDRSRQFSVTDRLPYVADTKDAAVELASLDVRVHVTGLFAETTQTLSLYNPNDRVLECNLCFPLPDDAVVCGYALDIDGHLVDGVVVPKEEARRIFEAEVRKGIDPGLVEQVQGNVYRTRIYPLPARGSRTVKIVYVSQLEVEGNDAAYHLPLGHAEGVDRVALSVEVSQAPVQPVLGGLGNLTLTKFDQRWVAEATIDPEMSVNDLQIRLPNLPDHVTAVERFGDDEFFCISSKIRGTNAPGAWKPERLAVLWDASGSRTDVNRDIVLIETLAVTWRNVTLDVRVLRDVLDPKVHTFALTDGDCTSLIAFLRGLAYDGGTNLAGLDLTQLPHPDDEAWLLFTDGLNTIGLGLPPSSSRRVFAVSGQPQSDSAFLRHAADHSGGAYFNLLTTSPGAGALTISSWTDVLRLERVSGCDDTQVFVGAGRLTVLGRFTEATASVRLAGPGAPLDDLTVCRETATSGANVARAWAGLETQLKQLIGADPARMVSLGRKYGLVTPGTSLLVLESLGQYLEYDVEPPETLPTMRAEFRQQRRATERGAAQERVEHLERTVALWQKRIEWWETDWQTHFRALGPKENGVEFMFAAEYGLEFAGTQRLMAPPPAMASMVSPDEMDSLDPADDLDWMAPPSAMASMVPPPAMASMASPSPMDSRDAFGEPAEKTGRVNEGTQASIQMQPWSESTPYLSEMRAAEDPYSAYLNIRAGFARSPAFFLDCADFFFANNEVLLGRRVLSNLLELSPDDPTLLRMYAWRMQQAGELDEAIAAFERVRGRRADEPQSHRDLALALEARWQRDGDVADARRAIALFYAVSTRSWDRFPEIELNALMELNRLLYLANAAGIPTPENIDPRLIRLLDLDVRISMSWDADLTDVDLHVFEPTGDHAYYGNNRTSIGGLVSRDVQDGYGPEEYLLRRSKPGEYTIKAHYFGSHQQTLTGPCTVIVAVFTNYARPNEERQLLTLRLERAGNEFVVGTIRIGTVGSETDWRTLFRTLRLGMSINEIVAVVGQPAELRAGDEMALIYRPAAGVEIHVRASPRLTCVQQRTEGAVLDLV